MASHSRWVTYNQEWFCLKVSETSVCDHLVPLLCVCGKRDIATEVYGRIGRAVYIMVTRKKAGGQGSQYTHQGHTSMNYFLQPGPTYWSTHCLSIPHQLRTKCPAMSLCGEAHVQIRKVKSALLPEDRNISTLYPKEWAETWLPRVWKFSGITSFKINMQKSMASIFYNDNQLEHVMGKQMTFTTATKKIKHLEYDTHTRAHAHTQSCWGARRMTQAIGKTSHILAEGSQH